MLKLKSIDYRNLTNDDFCGLHLSFVEQTQLITNEEVQPLIESYSNSVKNYSQLIGNKFCESVSKEIQRLDKVRNELVSSCRYMILGLKNHPDENVRNSVKPLLEFFGDRKNNPRHLNQSRSNSVIDRLLNLLKEVDQGVLNSFGLKDLFQNLESTQTQFLKSQCERSSIYSNRVHKDTWGDRQECLENFHLLTDLCLIKINLYHDEGCTQFIESINVLINSRKQVIKTNETKKQKKRVSGEPIVENNKTEINEIENKEVQDVV